jgi:hypothetical protein
MRSPPKSIVSLPVNTLFLGHAEILYCMIRQFKPRRMIEVGSGMSTLLAAGRVRLLEDTGADEAYV